MSLISKNATNIKADILEFLSDNSIANWNTLEIVNKILSTYSIVDLEIDIATITIEYESALRLLLNHHDLKIVKEAKRRIPAVARIMKSIHVINLFRSQVTRDKQTAAILAVKEKAIGQVCNDIESINSQGSSPEEKQPSKRQSHDELGQNNEKQKKQKTLVESDSFKAYFKDLSPEEALKAIMTSSDCKENVVDFTKPIAKKFRAAVPRIFSAYEFDLKSAVTLEERRVLVGLSLCRTVEDENKLIRSLFKQKNASENIKYLRTAINGLFDLWRSKRLNDENNEGWLRSNLYSFIWDRAFLFDETFFVKRAECYSAVIKQLKENNEDVAQQRVDFIFRSNHDGSDYLTSEEKPTEKLGLADFKKGKEFQRNMLRLWSNWLGSKTLVGELEAVTCQWQKRKLTVFGTRMLPSGEFLVYKKATGLVPSTSGQYSAAARMLQIVLSLKRLVTLNHMKLSSMIDAIEKHSNENLDLSINADQPYVTYYGSSQSSVSSKEYEEEAEYTSDALLRSRSVKHPDDVVSMKDGKK